MRRSASLLSLARTHRNLALYGFASADETGFHGLSFLRPNTSMASSKLTERFDWLDRFLALSQSLCHTPQESIYSQNTRTFTLSCF